MILSDYIVRNYLMINTGEPLVQQYVNFITGKFSIYFVSHFRPTYLFRRAFELSKLIQRIDEKFIIKTTVSPPFSLPLLSFDDFPRSSLFSPKLVKYFVRVSFHLPQEILTPAATSYSIRFESTRFEG